MRIATFIAVLAVAAAACSSGESVFSLELGDCFDDPETFDEVSELDTIDCSEPHDNEIYALET